VVTESNVKRRKREQQRGLFDGVADLYDVARRGYPEEIVDVMLATAAIGPGNAVLEIGCGTGQLTRQLAGRGLNVTAIDIGPAMIAAARRNVTDPMVEFQISAFEDFANGGPFDLIVSATAWHWIDPDVGWAKAARLLRPRGWLALLITRERYGEPFRTALRELWMRYSRQVTGWSDTPAQRAMLREATLFGDTVEAHHDAALQLSAEMVAGVECTHSSFLSYGEKEQEGFTADLMKLLESSSHVELIQKTFLTMAPVSK
jgi:SAM-dependent methyltransferase